MRALLLRSAPLPPWAPTPGPSRAPRSQRSPWTHSPKFGDSRGVAPTSEPFPGLRQVAGGPGEVADKPPKRVSHPPSSSWREPAARAPLPSAEVPSPRRTCAPKSYLWAPAGVPSSPCSSTAPWQPPRQAFGSAARRAARRRPGWRAGAAEVWPAGYAQPGAGLRAGPPGWPLPGSHAPSRPRAAGIPASGQTLLINRRTRRLRRPSRRPAFISARRGGPAPAPCPLGRPPRGPLLSWGVGLHAREGPPGGAMRARAVSRSLLRAPGAKRGVGGAPAGAGGKEGCLASLPLHPLSSHLTGHSEEALIYAAHLNSTTAVAVKACLPRLPPNLAGLDQVTLIKHFPSETCFFT